MSTSRLFTLAVICTLTLWTSACSSPGSNLDFRLTNLTGASLKYVYLSPSAASGWQENIVAGSDFKSGNSLNVRFNPSETATMWDLRIEGADGKYAEWKNLNLTEISEIKLRFQPSEHPVAIAQIE